ncbi:MAG: flagellar FlbD family protein [Caldicoprobacterales bacterium]|jgi:flagellar protein FlbD|nr:flagellar FlbD family protein [Clostridiales bacterium]
MIKVTRLNDKEFVINTEIIEFIESTPDTVITTTTGKKVIVKEDVDEVIKRVVEFKRKIFQGSYK